jgi:hypothetical protein
MNMTSKSKICAYAIGVLVALAVLAPAASAVSGPRLSVYTTIADSAQPGEPLTIEIGIQNTGSATSHGPISISDSVSPGLKAPYFRFNGLLGPGFFKTSNEHPESPEEGLKVPNCETAGLTFTCTITEALPPGVQMPVFFETEVQPGASGVLGNTLEVSGGETSSTVKSTHEIEVGPPQPFAINSLSAALLDGEDTPVAQAGSVPAQFDTSLSFKTKPELVAGTEPTIGAVEHFKDVTVHLPVGLEGNPTAYPTCTSEELVTARGHNTPIPSCPDNSQVGVAHLMIGGEMSVFAPVYNMVPPYGAATQLGFNIFGAVVVLDAYVRPGDDGIDIVSRNTSTTVPVTDVTVSVWGDPASHLHDRYRNVCLESSLLLGNTNQTCPSKGSEKAYLRLPTSCSGEGLAFGAESNSYTQPERVVSAGFAGPVMTGCERVPFDPTIFVQPTGTAANSPTGVAVQLSVPQSNSPEGVDEADLKKAVVRMPEGMVLNPSSADGLQACDDAHLNLDGGAPATCPEGSKLGSVLLHTPLLENPIEGFIWLRPQNSSDPASGEMFRIAIELRDDRHGVDIKLPGQVAADPQTGRLTSTFDNAPQLPFSDMTLHFKSGARAPLTTPFSCTPQTTEADMYSWAQPTVAIHKTMTFNLTSGPEGTPCTSTPSFNPGFNAGVSSVQAGAYTPFLATFSRKDSDQSMQRVSVKMPQGLLGSLVGLPLCPEDQANAGTCSQASEIGSVTAGAGDGPTPFYVTGGRVYMTGPYGGAPFGLSVVVPAKAGPFDLGTVVVRAKVEVDIHTAQLTVTTDPLPQIVGGVPVNLRLVNVTIDRPNFTYNPTNCDPMEVSGSMAGGQGATAALSNGFQVTNCGALSFKPRFTVTTSGKTSRAKGASLHVKLTVPAKIGEANIKGVRVELPKALPSRLTTLNHACPDSVFNQNPANCPSQSRVGFAKAVTPVLPVPLEGPAYFVSHGAQKFPELTVVLQGYGVTVYLEGETFISKTGITSSTFKAVPDVPVGSFELTLPEGPYSALAANTNLCAARLTMPTRFDAQDGAVLHQNTPIEVEGCPYSLRVLRRSVNKRTLTLRVSVPAAGRLVASGKGVSKAAMRAKGRSTLTLTLKEGQAGKLRTKIALRFTPKGPAGKQRGKSAKVLHKSITVTFR